MIVVTSVTEVKFKISNLQLKDALPCAITEPSFFNRYFLFDLPSRDTRVKTLHCTRVISSFRREVDENYALLGYYAACSGNLLTTFRDNLWVKSSRAKNGYFQGPGMD
jgi:hypothetical protein